MPVRLLKRLWAHRRDTAGAVAYWSGAGRLYEAMARPAGAIVLMYHSVARPDAAKFVDSPNHLSPEKFERQMAYLSRHRRVVPLSQVVNQIASGKSPSAGSVCITLDDGYLDNFTVAAPILEKYGLPATLYLATGYVERGETQWADRLYWLLSRRTAERLSVPFLGLEDMDMASAAERGRIRKALHRYLLESGYDDRTRLLAELEQQLKPIGTPPRLTMTWDEARMLHRQYPSIEIGGHTRDHLDLRTHRGEIARSQISGCAEDLRRELGVEPRHFSFPYSRWCPETRDTVKLLGWESAVGMGDDPRITTQSDRFAMPRVESPRTMTELRFRTSGAYPSIFSTLRLTR